MYFGFGRKFVSGDKHPCVGEAQFWQKIKLMDYMTFLFGAEASEVMEISFDFRFTFIDYSER